MRTSKEKTGFKAVYTFECLDKNGKVKWTDKITNLVPNVGLNKFLDATLKTGLASPSWFVGLKDAVAAVAGDTMASHAGWAELSPYSNATRPALTLGAVAGQSVDNSASKASFTIDATATIGGAFVTDSNTVDGATGILLSASNFTTGSKDVDSGDTLNVTVTFTAAAA